MCITIQCEIVNLIEFLEVKYGTFKLVVRADNDISSGDYKVADVAYSDERYGKGFWPHAFSLCSSVIRWNNFV